MTAHAIQAVKVNAATQYGFRGYQYDPAENVDIETADGGVYERGHHVTSAAPAVELTTRNLAAVFASPFNGSSDLPLAVLDGSNGIEMFGAKAVEGAPGFASGTVHRYRKAANGRLWVAGVSWRQGDKAEARVSGLLTSADGTTNPIGDTTTASLPTAGTAIYGYELTALVLAGVSVTDMQSVELGIDGKFAPRYLLGRPYPTAVIGAGPTGPLEVVLDVESAELATASGSGACSLVFTALAHGGGFSASTVTLTLNGAWGRSGHWSGAAESTMSKGMRFRTRHDGSNRPMTWVVA